MKRLSIAALLLLAGCAPKVEWRVEYRPMTEEERVKVSNIAARSIPSHPNPYDIETIYHETRITVCAPTLWEYVDGKATGRWAPVREVESNK